MKYASVEDMKRVLRLSQPRLAQRVERALRQHSPRLTVYVESKAYILGISPNSRILLCAHLDVFGGKPPRGFTYLEEKGILASTRGVLGGDDRAGVYIMLKLLELAQNPRFSYILDTYSFAFFWDEEKGCIGSSFLTHHRPELLDQFNLIIGLDRRGAWDAARYDTPCKTLFRWFEEKGFRIVRGSFSDCSAIGDTLGIPNINLSVGFEMEHSDAEVLDLPVVDLRIAQLSSEEWCTELAQLAERLERQPVPFTEESFLDGTCAICQADLDSYRQPYVVWEGETYCMECFHAVWGIDSQSRKDYQEEGGGYDELMDF